MQVLGLRRNVRLCAIMEGDKEDERLTGPGIGNGNGNGSFSLVSSASNGYGFLWSESKAGSSAGNNDNKAQSQTQTLWPLSDIGSLKLSPELGLWRGKPTALTCLSFVPLPGNLNTNLNNSLWFDPVSPNHPPDQPPEILAFLKGWLNLVGSDLVAIPSSLDNDGQGVYYLVNKEEDLKEVSYLPISTSSKSDTTTSQATSDSQSTSISQANSIPPSMSKTDIPKNSPSSQQRQGPQSTPTSTSSSPPSSSLHPPKKSIQTSTSTSPLMNLSRISLNFLNNAFGAEVGGKAEEVGFSVLEGFSKVTKGVKEGGREVLEHPLSRPLLQHIPEGVRNHFLTSEEADLLLRDYDSASIYLRNFSDEVRRLREPDSQGLREPDTFYDFQNIVARKGYVSHFTGTPLTIEKWGTFFSPISSGGKFLPSPQEVTCLIFCGGVEPQLRKTIWPRLLHAIEWTASLEEELSLKKREEYTYLKQSWQGLLTSVGTEVSASSPTRVKTPTFNKEGIPSTGMGDENLQGDVLSKVLERHYRIDKDVVRTDQGEDFFRIVGKEVGSLEERERRTLKEIIELKGNEGLEVLRNLLMTYTVFNFDLGYVQGMNDLCSPLLETVRDEALTFWCFVGFMERMAPNFNRDQAGMHQQLNHLKLLLKILDPALYRHFDETESSNMFCAFRWLLILFKREFYFDDVKLLWESIWTCPLTSSFHLFLSIAILNNFRQDLLKCRAFDEVLKYINNLAGKIFIPEIIQHAEILFYVFRDEIIINGPEDLRPGILQAIKTNQVEELLSSVSGISNKEASLGASSSTSHARRKSNGKLREAAVEYVILEEEWFELLPLLQPQMMMGGKGGEKGENGKDTLVTG